MKWIAFILLSVLGLLLSVCSPSTERIATQTAEAAYAAATRIASGPTPGLWRGTTELVIYHGLVSFEVDSEGNVRNLKFELNIGRENNCMITAGKIEIKEDRKFSLTFGDPVYEDENLIFGYFHTRTSIDGYISSFISCVDTAGETRNFMSSPQGTWSAKWTAGQ